MVDIQTVSIAIASAGVFAAAIYYILQIRHQSKVRQTDLLLRIYSTFGTEEFQKALTKTFNMEFKDYNDFVKKYSSPTGFLEKPESIGMGTVNILFEEIGVLLSRKLIDLGLVDDLFGYVAIVVWEKIKPAVEGWRKQFQIPRSLQQFEYLYNELKKREQKLQQKGVKNG
jgi:hypothetical protein